jgi:hypothetical protein
MGEAATVAAHACRTRKAFEDFREVLTGFSHTILRPGQPVQQDPGGEAVVELAGPRSGRPAQRGQEAAAVVELAGVRPGRPVQHRIRAEIVPPAAAIPCVICSGSHHPSKCPQRGAVLLFSERTDGREDGQRHCAVCGLLGHVSTTCPALHRYRAQNHRQRPEHDREGRDVNVGEIAATNPAMGTE